MNTVILRSNINTKIVLTLFLLFFCSLGYTQDTIAFKQQWRQVDSLVKLQRPASAIKYLQEIETEALASKNETHYIMAKGLHISFERYQSESSATHLNQLEAEMLKAQTPVAKALWNTITANAFYNYFENNRNKLYNNRNFRDSSDNYEKYTVNQILNKTKYYYLQALKEEKALQSISIKTYAPLFEYVDKNLAQKDNLYVSILLTALDFFKNQSQFSYFDEANKKQGTKPYQISHNAFMRLTFIQSDTVQNLDIAMRLYQDLMHYYQEKNDLEKVIFYEIKRIEYLKGNNYNQEHVLAFKQLLDGLCTEYPQVRNTAKAKYLSINISENYKLLFYENGTETFTQQLVKAYQKLIEQQPGTEGAMLAYNRLNKLLAKNLDITTEKVALTGPNIRALIQYTNVDTINIRIFKTSANPFTKVVAKTDRPYFSNSFTLPKGTDLEAHSVELNLGQLPLGHYAIVIKTDSITLTKELQVSNVLILDNDLELFSLHRKTGQPLAECDPFLILNQSGNANWISMDIPESYGSSVKEQKRKWIQDKIEARANYTDSFPDNGNQTVYLGYVSNNDTLIEKEHFYFPIRKKVSKIYTKQKTEEKNIHTYYFVDRPIYRPGQQVHFKVFVVNSDKSAKQLMQANKKIKVMIDDVEGNTVFEKTFTSNEFGTFSGTFTIPEDGPLGLYDISDDENYGYGEFSVEAYKKPQLQIQFDKGSKTLAPNQSVSIGGTVSYLSGAPASFCNLSASIQKKEIDKSEYMYSNAIAYYYDRFRGEDYLDTVLTTDENGRFELSFYSQTDTFYWDGSKYPYSLFNVEIMAKDQTGEETTEKEIYVSNISPYAIHFHVNRKDFADSFKSINLAILNHDKQPVTQKVRLKVSELEKPETFLKERLWRAPTDLYYTADSIALLFPGEATGISTPVRENNYYDEKYNLLHQRKVILTVLDTTLSNDQIKNIQFSKSDWPHSTYYKFEVWDPKGYLDSTDAVQYSFIYNNDDPAITDEPIVVLNNHYARADQQQTINIATFTPDAHLFFYNPINKYAITQKSRQFNWNGRFLNAHILFMSWCFIYNNRIYEKNLRLYNPSDDNNINFKINIPKQVLQPGQKVSWPVEVNAQGKKQTRYELIATLYDAALDKLADSDNEGWINRKLYQYRGRKYTHFPEASWSTRSITTDIKGQQYIRPDLAFKNRAIPSLRLFGTNVMLRQLSTRTINLGTIILEDADADAVEGVTVFGKKIDRRTYVGAISTSTVNGYSIESNTADHLSAGSIRKNFTESAYFNAHLKTDKKGRAFINFTVPDALTKWKLKILAHDKSLNTVTFETEILSQKELMVSPHLPRFLRQQDAIDLKVKLSNLSDKADTVTVFLALKDSVSGKDISKELGLRSNRQEAVLTPHSSHFIEFPFKVPVTQENPVQLLVTAKGKQSEDGEQHTLNIEPAKLILTENLHVYLNEQTQDTFGFPAFKNKFNQVTSQSLSIRPDKGPLWSALDAYAYLATYPYNCTEQLLNKYLGLSMARQLLDSFPVLRTQINDLQKTASGNYNKQEQESLQALKQLNEQTKNNAAILNTFEQFAERQNENGSFSWFEGMPEDRQMSTYVTTSLARIARLDWSKPVLSKLESTLTKGIDYIDAATIRHLEELKKKEKPISLNQAAIDWLYLNSFCSKRKMDPVLEKYTQDLFGLASAEWQRLDNKNQATLALCLYTKGDQTTATNIVQALYEKSIYNEARGRYWNWNAQLNWTAGDIEAHTRILEAFSLIHKNEADIAAIHLWLLQNKKGSGWGTTINTAAANLAIASVNLNPQYAPGAFTLQLGDTGFIFNPTAKQSMSPVYTIDKNHITAVMGNVMIKKTGADKTPVSAHISWTYEEALSTVHTGNTEQTVQINKKIYKTENHKEQPVLLKENDSLKVGDKLLVRINITSNRDLSYILLKDMRCTATEPIEKISAFKYQNDLAYYQSHHDKASDFFFNHIKKGNWYLEYEIMVNQSGHFQSGIATLEDLYQPEINAYSGGIPLHIK